MEYKKKVKLLVKGNRKLSEVNKSQTIIYEYPEMCKQLNSLLKNGFFDYNFNLSTGQHMIF